MCRSLIFLLLLSPLLSFAQQMIQLSTHQTASHWQVVLRPTEPVNGVLSNLQFTLSWPQGSSLPIGATPAALQNWIDMVPAGPDSLVQGWWSRTYVSFGHQRLDNGGSPWVGGSEQIIWEISSSQAPAQLTADRDVEIAGFQTGFYAELDGVDVTGDVVSSLTEASFEGKAWLVYPNPASDFFTIEYEGPWQPLATATLFSLKGELIRKVSLTTSPQQMMLNGIPAGIYFLAISGTQHPDVYQKILVR